MTHEELLAVLNDVITDDVHHVATQTAQALRAVVELHKPFPNLVKGYSKGCEECSSRTNATVVFYPCPTIQAIEEELK